VFIGIGQGGTCRRCRSPKCFNLPSLAANPPQTSRNDLTEASWQNNVATNYPQLLKPRVCRSALCLCTAASQPIREMGCNICEKMLHTLLKAESSSDFVAFGKLNLSQNSAQQRGANLNGCDRK